MNSLFLGKVPQSDLEIEMVVLGTIMLDKDAMSRVADVLRPECFYKDAHQMIYAACVDLHNNKEPIDLLMVSKMLRSKGQLEQVGGAYYVTTLTDRVASSANLEFHAEIIRDKYLLREIGLICAQGHNDSFSDESVSKDLSEKIQAEIQALMSFSDRKGAIPISEITKEAVRDVEARLNSESGISGIPKGIRSVDAILGGYQKTDLIYIAARPGMGKTADVLSDALRMAKRGVKVAVFSLEMSSMQLVHRLAAQISGIDVEDVSKRKLDNERLTQFYIAIDVINSLPIFIDDTPALSVFDLRSKVSKLVSKRGVEIVFVDYVQLMSVGQAASKKMLGNREQEISAISRNLKLIAKENNIPMVVLAQLSRQVETRSGSKRPILSDLRESGSLEQDADVVAFLYRPEYYGINEQENGESTAGLGEFIVAKHRNGATGIANMMFTKHLAMYSDWETQWRPSADFDANKTIQPKKNFLEEPF